MTLQATPTRELVLFFLTTTEHADIEASGSIMQGSKTYSEGRVAGFVIHVGGFSSVHVTTRSIEGAKMRKVRVSSTGFHAGIV